MMKESFKKTLVFGSSLVATVFGVALAQYVWTPPKADLSTVAAELKKQLPMMVDQYTMLINAEFKSGVFTYVYSTSIEKDIFTARRVNLKDHLLKGACQDKFATSLMNDYKVPVEYRYLDSKKEIVGSFQVRKSDCKPLWEEQWKEKQN
ncbi:hypothetical protein [Bdellovibrio sp. HCB-162]|uniref:hypothetical protein n=1 Tax=Bdellovibrio sp. HCB-162 TaxID=3394234 RepID=UPI0039BC653D